MPSERVQRQIDRILDRCEEAVDDRDWDLVRELCDSALRLDPDNEDALAYLGASGRDTGIESGPQTATVPPNTGSSSTAIVSTPDDQPSSFASGRYTVSKFLGEGGKKKVYLAHDNTLDRDVAFALIKTAGLDETSRERVKREAQAMGRMGTHPCIMPIYDLGEEPDASGVAQPFMVQPLMGGGDVEGLIEDAGGPLALEDAIRIASQTAQGLVFAHGKGIVHRDLKPGNVWLDEEGAAKIGDFGLAVATDRSRLTVEKVMVGTVSYMPPEQATGGKVTPRADLYSLGAMLYEMCTGRVPFIGDDDIGVISQHINTPPVAPSWHNSQIPKTLDALILRLLAKDPAERPADAGEVLDALAAVDLSAVEEREEGSQGSLDSMAGGVFVGRQREMDRLKAAFEEVLSGKGRMFTLVGEPGIGKTRIAQELATYAGMRGATVLWGRSYESGGAPPYWPWVQAIRSYVAPTEPQELRNQLGSAGPVIAEVVADIREKLPDLQEPTKIEDPESARFRLFDSISTFLKQASQSAPIVLMLEDLHWADKPSLMLLEFIARELVNLKILIIGNYRDVELSRRHPLSVTLGDLSRERLFERVVLRGLQRHDVERFIQLAAGINPPAALVDTVHSQTEGNPLFVTETVRLLIQEGDISSGRQVKGGTTSWEIRIPEGVREVIGRRLDRLSERCNEVLIIAAVIGRQFRFDVLEMLVEDTTDNQLLDAMDEALAARIVEELPDQVGLYQFTHASMQETLTGELSANRRVRMHARIAEALETYWGDASVEHAAELVEHFAEAETVLGTNKLLKYALSAGDTAADSFAFEQATHYFEIAREIAESRSEPVPLAEALYGLVRAFAPTSLARPRQDIFDLLTRAFELYVESGHLTEATEVAQSRLALAGITGAIDFYKRAVPIAGDGTISQGFLLSRYGTALYAQGFSDESEPVLRQSLEIALNHCDRELEALARTHLNQRLVWNARYSEAAEDALSVIPVVKEVGDFSIVSRLNSHLMWVALALGKSEWAKDLALWMLESATHTGSSKLQAQPLGMIASVHLRTGEWEPALEYIERLERLPGEERSLETLRAEFKMQTRGGDAYTLTKNFEWTSLGPITIRRASIGILSSLQTGTQVPNEIVQCLNDPSQFSAGNVIANNAISTLQALIQFSDQSEPEQIRAFYERINSYDGSFDPLTGFSNGRVLGLLCSALGEDTKAADHFSRALIDSRNAKFRPELAWTCSAYSEFLMGRESPGDSEQAIELQDEAISIASELGMKPLLERVLAKREILNA